MHLVKYSELLQNHSILEGKLIFNPRNSWIYFVVFRNLETDDTLVPDMQHELARVKFNIIALEPSCVQIKILSVGASFVQGAKLKFMLDQKREDSKSKICAKKI